MNTIVASSAVRRGRRRNIGVIHRTRNRLDLSGIIGIRRTKDIEWGLIHKRQGARWLIGISLAIPVESTEYSFIIFRSARGRRVSTHNNQRINYTVNDTRRQFDIRSMVNNWRERERGEKKRNSASIKRICWNAILVKNNKKKHQIKRNEISCCEYTKFGLTRIGDECSFRSSAWQQRVSY